MHSLTACPWMGMAVEVGVFRERVSYNVVALMWSGQRRAAVCCAVVLHAAHLRRCHTARGCRYGSDDGGATAHADPRFDEVLRVVAQRLNLAPHKISNTNAELAMAGDVEGHMGRCVWRARVLSSCAPWLGADG